MVGPVAPEVGRLAPEVVQASLEAKPVNAEVEAVVSAIGVAAAVERTATKWHVLRCRRGALR